MVKYITHVVDKCNWNDHQDIDTQTDAKLPAFSRYIKKSACPYFSQSSHTFFYTFAIYFVNVKNNEYFRGAYYYYDKACLVQFLYFSSHDKRVIRYRYQRTCLRAKMRFNRIVRRSG